MHWLVTGGTGFIGSHLAEYAARVGHKVTVLGLTDRPEEKANAALLARAGVRIVAGSVTDPTCCADAMRDVTHVHHLAVAMRESGKRDKHFTEVNLGGTENLLKLSVDQQVERFVYCSTIGVFGHRVPGIVTENSPLKPGNIYEKTKVAAEKLVVRYHSQYDLPSIILRPADVFGPRDQRLLKLFNAVACGSFPLFGDGSGRRHMIYVDDVVAAFARACDCPAPDAPTIVIAGPEVTTLADLLDEIARAAGRSRYGIRWPLRPALFLAAAIEDMSVALGITPWLYRRRMDFFQSDIEFDIEPAKRLLGWVPEVGLSDGVARTLRAYRKAGLIKGSS